MSGFPAGPAHALLRFSIGPVELLHDRAHQLRVDGEEAVVVHEFRRFV